MTRAYNVVDADGHILEPLDLWTNYIDPGFRDRAPRLVKRENGQEQLVIETPGGQKVTLKDGAASVAVRDANGNSLRMDSSGVTVCPPDVCTPRRGPG